MRQLFALVLVLGAAWVLKWGLVEVGSPYETLTLALALLLIGGYGLGWLFRRFSLPKVSGYIVAGLILGPYVTGLETTGQVEQLELISHFALALISLAAGGELELSALRSTRRTIGLLVLVRVGVVIGGVWATVILASGIFPFLAELETRQLVVGGAIIGVLSFATSPSTLMAVISETRARGRFPSVALGATVVIDVLVVLLFAATLSFGEAFSSPGQSLELTSVLIVVSEVVLAMALGALLAFLLVLYLRWVGRELVLVVLAVGFLAARLTPIFSHWLGDALGFELHVEALLICLAAGFVLRNFSRQGGALLDALNESALPVYVAFFSLTGAALDVATLANFWKLAVFLVVARLFWLWLSGYLAGRLAGEQPIHSHWYGPSLSAQAGVSLGLAAMLQSRFPEMGAMLGTLCVAMIVLNQLVGPVLLKAGLSRTGDD